MCSFSLGQKGETLRLHVLLFPQCDRISCKQAMNSSQTERFFKAVLAFSERSRLLATPSTTEPPDRAASQQIFTSMPSESCFMCVLPATEGGERRKALKKKSLQSAAPSCNSEFPSNMLWEMKPRVLRKKHSLVLFGKYQNMFFPLSVCNTLKPHTYFSLTESPTAASVKSLACVVVSL